MKNKLKKFKKAPIFIFLLPVFFVLHGFLENYDFVSIEDAIILTITYLGASFVMLLLFWLFYENWIKAALVVFSLMTIHFLFGTIKDSLKEVNEIAFFTKYSLLLPAVLILLIIMVIYIKKQRRPYLKITLYLNILFVVLILIDGILLARNHMALKKERGIAIPEGFISADIPAKPDIYFMVLDEYAGQKQLQDQLGFDNSVFENQLRQRNFYIVNNSISNYTSTPLSIASLLTMNYLDMRHIDKEQDRVLLAYHYIRESILFKYFRSQGYELYNHSIFDLPGERSVAQPTFLPTGTSLITSQTFLSRVKSDIGFHLFTTLGFKQNTTKHLFIDLQNNNKLYDQTFRLAATRTQKPKFIYAHLLMPHYPYYFTKTGNPRPVKELMAANKTNSSYYLEYLQYCNQKLLALVDEIRKNSTNALILLTGDHGFRAFDEKVDKRYFFYNLCGVYLPSHNYSRFYDGLSAVNFFRTVLNTEFKQQLPLLKDSSVVF
jgi:hypothetical protein